MCWTGLAQDVDKLSKNPPKKPQYVLDKHK